MNKLNLTNRYRFAFSALTTMVIAACVPAATISPALAQGDPVVVLETSKGRLAIRVFRNMVPRTANNFLDLVSRGYYDGKTFHRVEGWVVQGGCPYGNGQGNYTDPDTGRERFLPLEINRNLNHNQAGAVAMARGNDPNSASCQFYILKKPMSQLNGRYAVFGGVVGGIDTIYRISPGDRILSARIANAQPRQSRPEQSEPSESSASSPSSGSAGSSSSGSSGESGF
jgi:peptidyl-prolyl cis-trans isomerase B (cyclophilin B)